MVELEQMREKYQLQDKIELLGSIPPSQVRDVSPVPFSSFSVPYHVSRHWKE